MMLFHEDLVLYTATNKDTHKVEELEKNRLRSYFVRL